MKLYLVRHGIAIDRDDPAVKRDEDRWLTDEGKQRTREVAEGLSTLGVKVDAIFTSPLRRAMETAEILNDVLKPERMKEINSLRPGFSPTDLCEDLLAEGELKNIMIVGHEPDFSELIAMLVFGDDTAKVTMRKAGVALLLMDSLLPSEEGVSFEWLLPPKVLCALKRDN